MENQDKAKEGICIVSFDGGGPGSMSQLRILDEIMTRLAFKSDVEVDELLPADYFDLMGGVGFGGLVAILLGRLRMSTSQAMEELAAIGAEIFPEGEGMVTTDVNTARLRKTMENMLERCGHSVDTKMRDNPSNMCKVVLFAAPTAVMDHCQPFRSYRSPRNSPECTLVDAVCATMATPQYFSPVAVGPRLRKQTFAGIPRGFNNPTREVLKEAQVIFGENNPVSLVLSFGAGQRASLSDLEGHITRLSRVRCDTVARELQYQLRGFGEYIRLNVDRGLETIELDDWHELGSIETHTNVYLEMNQITTYIDKAFQWLLQRNGSITLGQLSGSSTDCVIKFHSETLEKYLAMEFKQMHEVIQQSGIAKITLVDAIGNDIPIPTQFCVTYSMLSDVISVYFKHQKAPGSDFVERGDYRLVHGDHRNTIGPTEWTCIEKSGLKVEMSMILRTRNEDEERCPGCGTMFEGRSIDGWARCLSCSRHFQIETQVQSADTQSEDNDTIEPGVLTPAVEGFESKSSETLMKGHKRNAEGGELQFRLISVINLLEITAPAYPEQYAALINPTTPSSRASSRRASPVSYTSSGYALRASSFNPPISHFSNRYPRAISFDPSALMTRDSSIIASSATRCTKSTMFQRRPAHTHRLAQAYIDYDYDRCSPFVMPYDGSIPAASGEARAASRALTGGNARQRTYSPAPVAGKPKKKLDISSLFQNNSLLREAQRSSNPTPVPAPLPARRHPGVLGRSRMIQPSITPGSAPATPPLTQLTSIRRMKDVPEGSIPDRMKMGPQILDTNPIPAPAPLLARRHPGVLGRSRMVQPSITPGSAPATPPSTQLTSIRRSVIYKGGKRNDLASSATASPEPGSATGSRLEGAPTANRSPGQRISSLSCSSIHKSGTTVAASGNSHARKKSTGGGLSNLRPVERKNSTPKIASSVPPAGNMRTRWSTTTTPLRRRNSEGRSLCNARHMVADASSLSTALGGGLKT